MNNEMLYTMFANTLSKMNEQELQNSLLKAKSLLSGDDYEKLIRFIEEEKKRKNK